MLHDIPKTLVENIQALLLDTPAVGLKEIEQELSPYFLRVHEAIYIPKQGINQKNARYTQTSVIWNPLKKSNETFYIRSPGTQFQLLHINDIKVLRKKYAGLFSYGTYLNKGRLFSSLFLAHIFCPRPQKNWASHMNSKQFQIEYNTQLLAYNLSVQLEQK